jgi:hypothetical protein
VTCLATQTGNFPSPRQAQRLRSAAASERAGASAGSERAAELQRLLDDLSAAREADAAALSDARRAAAAAGAARARAEAEKERAAADLRAAEAELQVKRPMAGCYRGSPARTPRRGKLCGASGAVLCCHPLLCSALARMDCCGWLRIHSLHVCACDAHT